MNNNKEEEILKLANECLNCKNPLCKKGCPVETNIPEFINEIKNKNFKQAFYILQENNMMSYICSNTCPFEQYCQNKCIKAIKGNPVQIYKLENFVNKWAKENKLKYKVEKEKSNNIKIAVIGAGPSGISCALELSKKGYLVDIFEKENKLGGLLTYGIPEFRLSKKITEYTINNIIKEFNINIKTKMELGKDFTLEKLKKKYRAIFIGIGNDISSEYRLTEKNITKTYKADEFLEKYNTNKKIKNLGKVIIIGGGNVAVDSSRAALKMGAKEVNIIYRKNDEEMPARQIEIKEALKDGVKIIYETKVIKLDTEDKCKMNNVECIKTKIENNEYIEIKNSNFKIEANTIIFAIGLITDIELLKKEQIKFDKNKKIITDENNMTNIKGVFAGGDAVNKKGTVCKAIQEGKMGAKSINNLINLKII